MSGVRRVSERGTNMRSGRPRENMLSHKVEERSPRERQRIEDLRIQVETDTEAMLELADIAYMQQRREESTSEGQ